MGGPAAPAPRRTSGGGRDRVTACPTGWGPAPPAPPFCQPLARACHPEPTVAVTAMATALGAGNGRPPGGVAAVALAVLAGQLSVGWHNDWFGAERDRRRGPAPPAGPGGKCRRGGRSAGGRLGSGGRGLGRTSLAGGRGARGLRGCRRRLLAGPAATGGAVSRRHRRRGDRRRPARGAGPLPVSAPHSAMESGPEVADSSGDEATGGDTPTLRAATRRAVASRSRFGPQRPRAAAVLAWPARTRPCPADRRFSFLSVGMSHYGPQVATAIHVVPAGPGRTGPGSASVMAFDQPDRLTVGLRDRQAARAALSVAGATVVAEEEEPALPTPAW